MKIALVCDYSLDYLGGAQSAFGEQVTALVDAGHEVLVVAPRGAKTSVGATNHEWVAPPFSVRELPIIRNTAKLRARLRRVFESADIEVVHVHSEFGLVAASIRAAHDLGLEVAHTVHTFFWRAEVSPPLQPLAAAIIRGFHRLVTGQSWPSVALPGTRADAALRSMTLSTASRADVVISPSSHQRDALVAAGLPSVLVLPNTVSARPGPRPAPLTEIVGPLRVIWVGRCVPEKRLVPFVTACVRALAALPVGSLSVEVAGDGPDLAEATRVAAGRVEISFSGRLRPEEVFERLSASHLSALTSSGFDNQPMTVVESLFASRPVLYVDAQLTEGLDTGGILCDDDSVEAMTASLVALALDGSEVVRVSALAGAAFDRFSPTRFARDLEAIYRQDTVAPLTA